MFCRYITTFICIFVAAVIATLHNDSHFITESDPEVSVYHLTTEMPESSEAKVNLEGELTVAVDLPNLLDAGVDAVVVILSGDTHLVAHRAVLAARSPVFADLLGDGRLGRSSDYIVVPDVEGPVLRQLVAYLYTLQAPELSDMAAQLLVAADKFGVSSLKAACEQQVAMWLTVENAAATLALAIRHSCDWLRKAAVTFIEANLALVMAAPGWAEVEDEVRWLFPELPGGTSTPAPADSETTPATEPHSDHTDHGRTPATAGPTTTVRHSPTPGAVTVSLLHTPAPGEGRTTPTTVPHSNHGDHGQTLALSGQTTPAGHTTTQTDDAAVSLLDTPAPAASGATPTTQPHSSHSGQTPASAVPTTTTHPVAKPDYAAVCPLWSLSPEEKNGRLIEAAAKGTAGEVEALLAAGADVEFIDKWGWTALHLAAIRGDVEMVRCLLEAGAPVQAREHWLWTPLHHAAGSGRMAVVRLLLEEASADPNARDGFGRTPLHWAAFWARDDVVAVLLQAGADKGATDDDGLTPLDVAREELADNVVDVLTRS